MNAHIIPIDLKKSFRLINHGPTVLLSSRYNGVDNVMAVGWSRALDYDPARITVVIDSETKSREFVDKTGLFVIQVPTVAQIKMTNDVGNISLSDDPNKLKNAGVTLFNFDGFDLPFVEGCTAWLACKVIPEKHNEETYDLFIGKVISAWADSRVCSANAHWNFDNADPSLRSIHHIAGGNHFAIGEAHKG